MSCDCTLIYNIFDDVTHNHTVAMATMMNNNDKMVTNHIIAPPQACSLIVGSWTKAGQELDIQNLGGANTTRVRLRADNVDDIMNTILAKAM